MTKEEFKNLKVGTIVSLKFRDGSIREIFAFPEYSDLVTILEKEDCYVVLCARQYNSKELFITSHEDVEEMKHKELKRYNSRIDSLNKLAIQIK